MSCRLLFFIQLTTTSSAQVVHSRSASIDICVGTESCEFVAGWLTVWTGSVCRGSMVEIAPSVSSNSSRYSITRDLGQKNQASHLQKKLIKENVF